MKSAEGARRQRMNSMAAERNRSFEGRSSGSIVALMKPNTAHEFGDGSPLSLNRVQPYVPDDPFPMPPINQRIDMDFPIEPME